MESERHRSSRCVYGVQRSFTGHDNLVPLLGSTGVGAGVGAWADVCVGTGTGVGAGVGA